jgi:hypothetical protein
MLLFNVSGLDGKQTTFTPGDLEKDADGFLDAVGPDKAYRINFDKGDGDNDLVIQFAAVGGPERDGSKEMLKGAKIGDTSFLFTTQELDKDLKRRIGMRVQDIGKFAEIYFSKQPDVKLVANSDPELDNKKQAFFLSKDADGVYKSKGVTDQIGDYLLTKDGRVTIAFGGEVGVLEGKVLLSALKEDGKLDIFEHFDFVAKTKDFPLGAKLARGPKIQIAVGTFLDTAAYVKDVGGQKKMVLLDPNTLEVIREINVTSDYVTASADGAMVYHFEVKNPGEVDEIFEVTKTETADFLGTGEALEQPAAW